MTDTITLPRETVQQTLEDANEELMQHINSRFRVEKRTSGGFWPYCVKAGDGEMELFVGRRKQCEAVARRLTGACHDGAFMMKQKAAALQQAKPQAQAGEPEVVAWIGIAPRDGRIHLVVDKPSPTPMRAFNFQPLTYLHLHREAMAEQQEIERQLSGQLAAACVEALKQANEETKLYPGHEGRYADTITQAQEALK